MWTLGVSSGGLLLLLWICTGVRPVFCNRACCCSCTYDLNWLKSAGDAKDRLMLVYRCWCTLWGCSHLLLVVSRWQLLLCSRQIVAGLVAAVCWYACAPGFVTLTKLDMTWRDAQGRDSCCTRTQLGCVWNCYALPMRVCAVILQVRLAVVTCGACDGPCDT